MADAVDGWRCVAQERAKDAAALRRCNRNVGALYMLGYVVECHLKAYIQRIGRKPPAKGPSGHDLRGLWEAAGFKKRDLSHGRRWFIEYWSTSLRYEIDLRREINIDELYDHGLQLVSFIQQRTRWYKGSR